MAKGKQTCKILKEIRKQIAEDNDIDLVIEECTYKGDCLGTCPRCEAEVRYLERELEKRQRLGKVAVFAGMSIGTLFATASCDSTQPTVEKPLGGEVVAVSPDVPKRADDTIHEDLMGLVKLYRTNYPFDEVVYEQSMKDLFVFPEMWSLTIRGGDIPYERIGAEEACSTFEKLIAATKKFWAPYYPEGESKLITNLKLYLRSVDIDYRRYRGEMEVGFTVDEMGGLSDIEVLKSFNEALNADVVKFFEPTKWEPARYQLKDDDRSRPFACRCALTLSFPLTTQPDVMGIPTKTLDEPKKN